jgi:transcriptional regulator with XRE-family HTH domain
MLARTLQRMIRDQLTTAREISELTGVAPSTVYRWMKGRCEPDFHAIRILLRHLKNPAAQEALLAAFCAGTPWQYNRPELELDVNHDGSIDHEDALDSAIASVKSSATVLDQVRTACRRQGSVPAEDVLALINTINQMVRQCSITQQVLVQASEQQHRRKLKLAK